MIVGENYETSKGRKRLIAPGSDRACLSMAGRVEHHDESKGNLRGKKQLASLASTASERKGYQVLQHNEEDEDEE